MMDRTAIRAAEAAVHRTFHLPNTILIVELDGRRRRCVSSSRLSRRRAAVQVRRGWRLHRTKRSVHALEGKEGLRGDGTCVANYYVQDGVVPRHELPKSSAGFAALDNDRACRSGRGFHAGDGNLHPLICYDERHPWQSALAEKWQGRSSRTAWKPGLDHG